MWTAWLTAFLLVALILDAPLLKFAIRRIPQPPPTVKRFSGNSWRPAEWPSEGPLSLIGWGCVPSRDRFRDFFWALACCFERPVADRPVDRLSNGEDFLDFEGWIVAAQTRSWGTSLGIGRDSLTEDGRVGLEPDNSPHLPNPFLIGFAKDGTAPQSNHLVRVRGDLFDGGGFQIAERLFALKAEQIYDRLTGVFLDEAVGIRERAVEQGREVATDG